MSWMDWRRWGLAAQIGLDRLGLLPILALTSVLSGLVVALTVADHSDDSAALRETLNQRRAEFRSTTSSPSAAPIMPTDLAPQTLQQVLGEEVRIEAYLKRLFRIAEAHEIRLDQGEYKWQAAKSVELDRYQIRLPVKGGYAQIRAFCEQVLEEMPFAALEEFILKRESVGDEEVSASLQFSLLLHGSSAPSADVAVGPTPATNAKGKP